MLIAILAIIWFRFPSRKLTVIGVTGTDGKTTTASLIYAILKKAGIKASLITSVNAVVAGKTYDTGFHVTTPGAWWVQKYLREAIDHHETHMVLEVTSHALSQYRVFGVRFAVGVITNVTHEHLDWHKTYDHYLNTKLKLLRKAKIAILNRDEAEVYNKAVARLRHKKFITYGIRREALVNPQTFRFKSPLLGNFNRYNCLAAIAAVYVLNIPRKIILATVSEFSGVAGRMEVLLGKPFRVIVDFAHTPNALTQVLKTIRPTTQGRLIHIFGSAGLRDYTKRPLMGHASAEFADIIILTEEDYRTEDVNKIIDEIASGIPPEKAVYRYPDRGAAIKFALEQARPGDTVIITGKGHEQSLCRGKIEYPWSDQKETRKILRKLS